MIATPKSNLEFKYFDALERLRMHEAAEIFLGGGSWVFDIPNSTITTSKGWQEVHGTEQSVFTMEQLLPIANPEDLPEIKMAFANSINNGDSYHLTHRVIRQNDGKTRTINAYAEVVEKDKDGKPLKMFGMIQDITKIKSTQSERDNALERVRLAKEMSGIGVYEFDPMSGELIWDEKVYQLYGVEYRPVKYEDWRNALHPDDLADVEAELVKAIENHSTFNRMFRILRHGETRHIHCISSFVDDKMIGVNVDMTEEVLLKEGLRQSQKMEAIGHLSGGIAHDFNNQLASIMGFAELLEAKLDDPDALKYVAKISSAAEHSKNLTNQLLTFSRKQDLRLEVVNMHAELNDLSDLLKRSIDKKITIELNLDAEISEIMGDKSLIQNALLNLALNARDAMSEGGKIQFSTQTHDKFSIRRINSYLTSEHYIQIDVLDDGCGIPPDLQLKIFEPFFTTKELGKGTGMGLATVYGAIQQLGGEITVKSTVGTGTCFSIYLPLTKLHVENTFDNHSQGIEKQKEGKTILVVDDEPMLLELCQDFFELLGHKGFFSSHGHEAIDVFQEHWHDIDLVVLDMMMPGMNGKEVFEALVKINPAVKVIIASGFAATNSITEMIDLGVAQTISKPFKLDELKETINQVCNA